MVSARNADPSAITGENLPDIVKDALGDRNVEKERLFWAAMSPTQRQRSVQRIEAINRWHGNRHGWTADDAARAANLSKPRFYTLAMRWEDEEARSLVLLGVQAKSPRRRQRWKPEIVEAISDGAAKLVAKTGDAQMSVARLAEELHDTLSDRFADLPRASTLRSSIIEAQRLAKLGDEIGTDIAFDACAMNIPSLGDHPHVAFMAIDRATGYVLGAFVGDIEDSVSAYRDLARDVRNGVQDTAAVSNIPWAAKIERVELVIGADLDEFRKWEAGLKAAIPKVNIQGSNKPRRFGRYLKEHMGGTIGRVRLLPAQTLRPTAGYALPGIPLSQSDALRRLSLEILDYNRSLLTLLSSQSHDLPLNFEEVFRTIEKAS